MTDADPENPRPDGHYPRFADHDGHYVLDGLAQSISLGPSRLGRWLTGQRYPARSLAGKRVSTSN